MAIPSRNPSLAAGDTVYAIGRLDAIRRLESRATGTGPVTADTGPDAATSTEAASED